MFPFLTIVLAVWVILLGAVLALILAPVAAEPGPPPDPYEGEMREFRRAIHDWTRDN